MNSVGNRSHLSPLLLRWMGSDGCRVYVGCLFHCPWDQIDFLLVTLLLPHTAFPSSDNGLSGPNAVPVLYMDDGGYCPVNIYSQGHARKLVVLYATLTRHLIENTARGSA